MLKHILGDLMIFVLGMATGACFTVAALGMLGAIK